MYYFNRPNKLDQIFHRSIILINHFSIDRTCRFEKYNTNKSWTFFKNSTFFFFRNVFAWRCRPIRRSRAPFVWPRKTTTSSKSDPNRIAKIIRKTIREKIISKIIQLFHKKIHPELSTVCLKSRVDLFIHSWFSS